MRTWMLVAAFSLAACGSGTSGPSEPEPPAQADASVGGEGTICHAGERHPPGEEPEVHACAPGLSCCYPCGIPGCDSICMADCGPPRP